MGKNLIESLDGFAGEEITSLTVSENKLTSLEKLGKQPKLSTLDAGKNEIAALPEIKGYESLKTVKLAENKLADVNAFADAKSVTSVDLTKNEIADLSGIKGMENLATLTLKDNLALESLESLEKVLDTESKLALNIVGTKVALHEDDIKDFKAKFTKATVTYKDSTETK